MSELKQQVLTKPVEKIVERIVEGPVGAMKTEEEFLEEAQVKQEKRGREGERETYTVEEGDKEANQQGWGGEREEFIDNQIDGSRSVSTTPLSGDTASGHSWYSPPYDGEY